MRPLLLALCLLAGCAADLCERCHYPDHSESDKRTVEAISNATEDDWQRAGAEWRSRRKSRVGIEAHRRTYDPATPEGRAMQRKLKDIVGAEIQTARTELQFLRPVTRFHAEECASLNSMLAVNPPRPAPCNCGAE